MKNIKILIITCFLVCLILKIIVCQINDNFNYGILESQRSSILDVSDYLNLSLLVSSSGNIYNAIPFNPTPRVRTSANFNSSSAVAICNENYLIAGCLVDHLLVKININDGSFSELVEYSEFNGIVITNLASSCCVTIYENIVFIAISQSGTDDKIKNSVIKLKILNKEDSTNGPTIDNSFSKIFFNFPVEYKKTSTTRDVSCEAVLEQTANQYRLLCAYENKEETDKIVYLASINFDIENNFEKNIIIAQVPYEYGFRLYKLDNYYLRLVLRTGVYDIYLNSNFDIIANNVNNKLRTYNSYWNLFTYHNNRVITYLTADCIDYAGNKVRCSDMRIYTPNDDDYYLIITYSNLNEPHIKMYNYYNDTLDYLTIVYQSASIIYYITFQDNKDIYRISSSSTILRVKSNEEIDFDISNLIDSPKDFGKLYIGKSTTIYSSNKTETLTMRYPYESISFPVNKETQKLTLDTSTSLWYEFNLAYTFINEDYARIFYLSNAILSIRICAFQCGSCSTDYYICDTCRDLNYAQKDESENNDLNCYPINQIFEKYIYNSNTNKFEKCYSSCKFCSLSGSESSVNNHNCLSCAEGYIQSYEYLGNCYPQIETEDNIIIESESDYNFNIISSCSLSSKNYIISSTNECVTQCPETIPYNSYICNSIDFTEQEYGKNLPSECTATHLNPPKYSMGFYCYESCPPNSENIELTNECKCLNAWHKDITTEEIICYEENYCKYDRYKYYISDTKECTNSCPSEYFQFNFQCYSTGCPVDTTLIDSNKCESIYNYCYINQYYQNICSNEKDNYYILNFDNTKQYLKECSESLTYTTSEAKTYLYRGICYLTCPENSINNDEENKCKCLYFTYYSEGDENDYICYNEEEKCKDKIPVNDIKICLDSINDCITKDYKIFNNECYNNDCPPGTISLSSISNNSIKNKFLDFLGINNDLINKICVCDIINNESIKWTYNTITKEQECVYSCNEEIFEIEPEQLTHKCVDKCNPLIDYIFNNKCFKYSCPERTKLKNDGTRNCVCENSYYTDKENNMICCTKENEDDINCIENIVYPPEYYQNPDKCPAIYNNKCYSECPKGTCLTQKDINLIYCVKIQSFMTIFNDICFTNFDEIEYNIKSISDNNLFIIPSPNITIKAYSTDTKIDQKNSNYSYIELGECENTLKEHYKLESDTILYILGVETPNKDKQSSINVYNYGVYLENGTKLDLSICNGNKISIYSIITNKALIKLDEANYFYSYGYDIYNESGNFYKDECSSASIYGNDITLDDRYIDFYPSNISLCNDSCEFNIVNLTSEKIKCECDAIYNGTNKNETSEIIEEYSYTYSEYFLSLFNYKIIFCQNLLLNPINYLKNIGFYTGGILTLFSIVQMIINMTSGMKSLNKIIVKNEPSKEKLKEKVKEQYKKIEENNDNLKKENTKQKSKNLSNNNKKKYQKVKNSPPKKNSRNTNERKDTESLELKNIEKIKNSKGGIEKKEIKNKKEKEKEKEKGKINLKKNNKSKKKNIKKNIFVLTEKKGKEYINEINDPFSKTKLKTEEEKDKKTDGKETFEESIKEKKNKKRKKLNNYHHLDLIINKDDSIDKKQLNDVPFTQALRIDKRSLFEIFLYTIANKIEIINIFYYKNEYVHLSMNISLYLSCFLLDLALNCFFYTDDVVSEKYHNDGSLEMLTSLTLSFASNIFSSILTSLLRQLGEYSDKLEIIIKEINLKIYYYINMIKFKKHLKIRLLLFYIIQFSMYLLMTYYITIFCIIYSKSQISIMINYIYGVFESLIISLVVSIIITIMRYWSIKYKWIRIYRSSQYLYNKF